MNRKTELPLNHRISYLLLTGIAIKLLVDTSFQIFNPFLKIISAGAGISVVSLGGLIGARSLIGLGAPLIGVISDRIGYRKVMQISLLLTAAGMLTAGYSTTPFIFALGIILTGIGQAGFTPSIHAHTSTKLPYEKRAMGIGILEYSWALAGIIGLLAAGFLIEELSWRAPFQVLGFALLASTLFLFTLPESKPDINRKISKPSLKSLKHFFIIGTDWKSSWGSVVVQGFTMFSSMHLMIIHGSWLIDKFGLTASLLGTIALVMGITDLTASVTVSLITDKLGKKKSVAIGLAGMVLGFLILPWLGKGMILSVLALIIPRTFFEFAIVSNISLISEQAPEERGKMMSLGSAVGLIGITAASTLGPLNYINIGIRGLTLVSLATSLIALIILITIVREQKA